MRDEDPGQAPWQVPPDVRIEVDAIGQIYLAQLRAGQNPSRESFVSQYPAIADVLEHHLTFLDALHGARRPGASGLEPPERVGAYRIVRQLGEGGMGIVYLTEQTEPLARQVALKLVKLGMDTRDVVTRFESERQTLALLNHPNIAQVHDAGATEAGRPYFVMEYVQGSPLTAYCDEHRLTLNERLSLLTVVCRAVQHAHQKGIIHRDLKPSNILVASSDDQPVPKIIDFGVARAIHAPLTQQSFHTASGQVIGTPEYMSPEQATGNPAEVDTRTDIYSLGVILYELLVGVLPFDPAELRKAGLDEVRRRIREEEPPRPSDRIDSPGVALRSEARRIHPRNHAKLLRGDLDWITLKALEKDSTRRYATASELAADIERYLANQPVLARPPSAAYRAAKFVRRHRGAVAAVGGILCSLLAGLAIAAVMFFQALKDREETQRATEFLQGVVDSLDPGVAGGPVDVGAVLDRASDRIGIVFRDHPRAEAKARGTIGSAYLRLGRYDNAKSHFDRALAIRRQELGGEHPDTLSLIHLRGKAVEKQGRPKEAARIYRDALRTSRQVLGPGHAVTVSLVNDLVPLIQETGQLEDAERLQRDTLDAAIDALGKEHPLTLTATANVAALLAEAQDYEAAEEYLQSSIDSSQRVYGRHHTNTLRLLEAMASLRASETRTEESKDLYLEILDANRRQLGTDHPETLRTMNSLGAALLICGCGKEGDQFSYSIQVLRDSLERNRRVLGSDHLQTIDAQYYLSRALRCESHHDEALSVAREAWQRLQRALGEAAPKTLSAHHEVAWILFCQERFSEAEPLFRDALKKQRGVHGEIHRDTMHIRKDLRMTLDAQRKFVERQAFLRETIDILSSELENVRRSFGESHLETARATAVLADMARKRGDHDRAEGAYRQALTILRRVHGDDYDETLAVEKNFASLLIEQGRFKEAESLARRSVAVSERELGPKAKDTLYARSRLALVLAETGRLEPAERLLRQALEDARETMGDDDYLTELITAYVGRVLRDQGRLEEAELFLRKARQGSDQVGHVLLSILVGLEKWDDVDALAREVDFKHLDEDTWKRVDSQIDLATAQARRRAFDEATRIAEEAYDEATTLYSPGHWYRAEFQAKYGTLLVLLERYPEAETNLLEGFTELKRIFGLSHHRPRRAIESLIHLYQEWGRPREAMRYAGMLEAATEVD